MRISLWLCGLLVLLAQTAQAQVRDFPYRATVDAPEVYLRSGPGQRYYPTGKIAKGTTVEVHRHDPGGWYMITPPPGSFSLIVAEAIHTQDDKRGIVTANNVPVWVGSTIGETHDVEQQRLSNGDQITILGDVTLPVQSGTVKFYKIVPPQFEYRWIPGQSLVPADQQVRAEQNKDPFAVPVTPGPNPTAPKPVEQFPAFDPELADGPLATEGEFLPPKKPTTPATPVSQPDQTVPKAEMQLAAIQRLKQLDDELTRITNLEMGQWEFEKLIKNLEELKADITSTGIAREIDIRLATIDQYEGLQEEYFDLMKLIETTNKKEAELIAQQQSITGPLLSLREEGSNSALPDLSAPMTSSQPMEPTPAIANETPIEPTPVIANNPSSEPAPPTPAKPAAAFDGAGIVEKLPQPGPGGATHALFAPDGRVLAYLTPKGEVNLDQHIGKQRGITGKRGYNDELQADLIIVEGLTPVRLK